MVKLKDIQNYLSIVQDLKTEYKFYDMHVHPFEIIYDAFKYEKYPSDDGLYCLSNQRYSEPVVGDMDLLCEHASCNTKMQDSKLSNLIGLRRIYCHIGPKIFEAHMKLSGIDEILLLPVAQSEEQIDFQMRGLKSIFGSKPNFRFGYSVPNSIQNCEIINYLKEKMKIHEIEAIKLHPNITEIDLGTTSGKERVENILAACGHFQLPLIIHGGRSPLLKNKEAFDYGHLKKFKDINWDITSAPVILAHGGLYGCDLQEADKEVLPLAKKFISKHANVFIDVAGLDFPVLINLIRQIDSSRIVLGSDSLYYHQWATVVKLIHALKQLRLEVEAGLINIMSTNPANILIKKREKSL